MPFHARGVCLSCFVSHTDRSTHRVIAELSFVRHKVNLAHGSSYLLPCVEKPPTRTDYFVVTIITEAPEPELYLRASGESGFFMTFISLMLSGLMAFNSFSVTTLPFTT